MWKKTIALSDTKLKSILNKTYTGFPELTDANGLGVRISQKGIIAFQISLQDVFKMLGSNFGVRAHDHFGDGVFVASISNNSLK